MLAGLYIAPPIQTHGARHRRRARHAATPPLLPTLKHRKAAVRPFVSTWRLCCVFSIRKEVEAVVERIEAARTDGCMMQGDIR